VKVIHEVEPTGSCLCHRCSAGWVCNYLSFVHSWRDSTAMSTADSTTRVYACSESDCCTNNHFSWSVDYKSQVCFLHIIFCYLQHHLQSSLTFSNAKFS